MEMPSMTSTQKVIRMLRTEVPGAEISFAGSGHIRMTLPNGRNIYVSATPSDEVYFLQNVRADIKRALRGGNDDNS
jgi:hypothetical protein